MTEDKRYTLNREGIDDLDEYGLESPILLEEDVLTFGEVIDKLNEQDEQIKELKSENKMLKITISRNEAYINKIKTIGKWNNTGDVE